MILHGRYAILKEIGKGGNAHVFQVYDQRLHMELACKRIPIVNLHEKKLLQQEADILTKLNHPHIPRILDVFQEANFLFLVMDYIHGISLMDMLTNTEKITKPQLLSWMRDVADIMIYLHENKPHPILYLDLKPQNLILSQNHISLIDFGSSMMQEHVIATSATPGYAAPEVMEAQKASKQSDIYSFGVTFFVLIHARFPIQEKGKNKLEKLLLKCCEKEIKKRYEDFQDIKLKITKLQKNFIFNKCRFRLYLGLFLLSFCCFLFSIFIAYQQDDTEYQKAMLEKNYLLAIRLAPKKCEPYIRYYEKTCQDSASCQFAYQTLVSLSNTYKVQRVKDIAWFLGIKSMEQQTHEGYQNAKSFFVQIKDGSEEERTFIKNIIWILDLMDQRVLTTSNKAQLAKTLNSMDTYTNSFFDLQERYTYVKLLLITYDVYRDFLDQSDEHIIALSTSLLQQAEKEGFMLSKEDRNFVYVKLAYAYYYQGLHFMEEKEYVQMKGAYEKAMEYFVQTKLNTRFNLMAVMAISCIEFSDYETDINRYTNLAQTYINQISDETTKKYLQDLMANRT